MILILVISKPSYIDYGVYSISIREEMVMDPLYPVSDSFLSVFAMSGDLPPGLHFNETTGVISGSPLQESDIVFQGLTISSLCKSIQIINITTDQAKGQEKRLMVAIIMTSQCLLTDNRLQILL